MIPLPSKEFVESKGGVYHAKYRWPMSGEDVASERAWKTPVGMLRHEHVVDGWAHVYALPVRGAGVKGAVVMCQNLTYDTEAA